MTTEVARCQAWRYVPHRKHPIPGRPGTCRRCWRACNKIVPFDAKRCSDCYQGLLTNPSPEIRRALALEEGALDETLRILSQDPDYSVALTAQNLVTERRDHREAARITPRPLIRFDGTPGTQAPLPWANR
ncbi:hypothetical protein [Frigoribacterium sp. SL97]|uniref:hypothetical protein n=1 Tax=Frigoribacterium sp. SL97 TaxID=2994664 RepID=UPI00226FBDB8|nr:hypothetical protein [Frigoribacterium sp. SL97]WAC50238.1 hypothetical protein OVA02_10085 [Frigoribacterium sp. SL97]